MNPNSALAQAESLLLTPFSLTEGDLARTFGQILTHQVDYADLYFQHSRSEAWSLDEGIVKSGSFNIDQGVGVRAISGEKTAFAYSDDISARALGDAASAVRAIAAAGQNGILPAFSASTAARSLYIPHDPIASLPAEAKVKLLERLEGMARSLDPRVIQVMASLAGEYEVILVAGSDGRLAADIRPLVRCSLSVIVEENGRREQGGAGGGGRFDFAYFDDAVLQRYAQEAVHQAVTNLNAAPAPAGQMTVVLGSGWPGILLHEAVGHGLEGDFNRKGTSAFTGMVGKVVASPLVTVVDDGTIDTRRGSLNVDDEGTPTQRNVLIDNGVLRGYLQDRTNARLMGGASTGSGRRESYASMPLPRMTNTFMLAGQDDPAEIIAGVSRGIYAVAFGGGQVDITSGKFTFSGAEAYLIEDGKVTAPVRGATFIGNGPEVLKRVVAVGHDLLLDEGIGTCGKDGQSVPVGVGLPTVRVNDVTVGGVAVGGRRA